MKPTVAKRSESSNARLVLLFLSSISVGLVANAAPSWRMPQASTKPWVRLFATTPMAADALRPNEQVFLEGAIYRSGQERRLAEIGASQATSSDVRTLALQMSGDHRQLTDTLEALLRKKGVGLQTPTGRSTENHDRLLELTGRDFDREFVLQVSKLHDELMGLFEQVVPESRDADIKDMAGNQLPMLRDHRNKLLELKKSLD
jgi:predicted outer membrane protein